MNNHILNNIKDLADNFYKNFCFSKYVSLEHVNDSHICVYNKTNEFNVESLQIKLENSYIKCNYINKEEILFNELNNVVNKKLNNEFIDLISYYSDTYICSIKDKKLAPYKFNISKNLRYSLSKRIKKIEINSEEYFNNLIDDFIEDIFDVINTKYLYIIIHPSLAKLFYLNVNNFERSEIKEYNDTYEFGKIKSKYGNIPIYINIFEEFPIIYFGQSKNFNNIKLYYKLNDCYLSPNINPTYDSNNINIQLTHKFIKTNVNNDIFKKLIIT